jgi:hypothetical protein
MKRFEVKAICTMVFPNIQAESEEDAIDFVANTLPNEVNNKEGIMFAIHVDDVMVRQKSIMNTSNNHDPKLVERINRAYEEEREKFHEIVNFLIEKQGEGRFSDCATMFVRSQFYCQCIADDQDLETILCYCRV